MIVSFNLDLSPEDIARLRKAKQEGEVELQRELSKVLHRLADSKAACQQALASLKGHV